MVDKKLFNCIAVILTRYSFDYACITDINNSNVFLQYLFYTLSLNIF